MVLLESPAGCVGHQFLRAVSWKLFGPRQEEGPQARQSIECRAAQGGGAGIDRPPGLIDGPPPANGVVVLECKSQWIDERVRDSAARISGVLWAGLARGLGGESVVHYCR